MVKNNMEKPFDKNLLAILISCVLISITGFGCLTYYKLNELQSIKSNIESAIVKGVDPLSVRCSYDSSSTVCSIYASRK